MAMKLIHLPDNVLHIKTLNLVNEEREILSKVLWHLREIDRRKLYSEFKCSSLFDYCVKTLKYSEGQASRRVSACRLLKELPTLAEDIAKGDLNLTQLNQAKSFFADEKISDLNLKKEILDKLKGKSTRATEKILWDLKKEDVPKKTWVALNETTLDKISKVRDLRAHVHKDLDTFLVAAMEDIQTLWTPKIKRSEKVSSQTRYLPAALKAIVWKRDNGRCRNCGSTRFLEYDHIIPFSLGGRTDSSNIGLLCRNCNQRKGVRLVLPSPTSYLKVPISDDVI
jgi:5-methylcytosine-specific restriction endonuclease McrA